MKFCPPLALALVALAAMAAAQDKPAEKKDEPRVLKVKLNYIGAGKVDATHPIFVFIFDSPDLSAQAMPIGSASTVSKDGTVTFSDVPASPVYVGAVYDPDGKYDGQSTPPDGSSIGLYSKTPGSLEPVKLEPGKTVEIEIKFDDSIKFPFAALRVLPLNRELPSALPREVILPC